MTILAVAETVELRPDPIEQLWMWLPILGLVLGVGVIVVLARAASRRAESTGDRRRAAWYRLAGVVGCTVAALVLARLFGLDLLSLLSGGTVTARDVVVVVAIAFASYRFGRLDERRLRQPHREHQPQK